jgi:hypothetical protein
LSTLVLAGEYEDRVAFGDMLPPYMVFCAVNANVRARGSRTSALIASAMPLPLSHAIDRQLSKAPTPFIAAGLGPAQIVVYCVYDHAVEAPPHDRRRVPGLGDRPATRAL